MTPVKFIQASYALLFTNLILKDFLGGRRFANYEKLNKTVTGYLDGLATEECDAAF